MDSGSSSSSQAYPKSLVPEQHDHVMDPNEQMNQQEAPKPNTDVVDVIIEVSPRTLLDSSRYVCEVCFKGFPREQNLALHRRVHNLPFTLKSRPPSELVPRRLYICPVPTCVHHNPSRAIGDFGGLKKHYLRKHCTEKNYKCDYCSKAYSVESDLKAHSKICSMKKYIYQSGYPFLSGNNFTAKDPQTLNKGGSSFNSDFPVGSTMSHPQTFGMGQNSSTLVGPPIWPVQNQFNGPYPCTAAYEPQLCQFGSDQSSLMTNPSMGLNFSDQIQPAFFSPTPTNQNLNQQGYQTNYDIGFYANLLRDQIPLNNVNIEDMSLLGQCVNVYGTKEGSSSFFNGGCVDPSSTLNMTPTMHNLSPNGMISPAIGSSVGGSYKQSGYMGYGVSPVIGSSVGGSYEQSGYMGYGIGSGQLDYGGGMEVLNFDHHQQQATGGSLAPSELQSNQYPNQHPNQQGYWF